MEVKDKEKTNVSIKVKVNMNMKKRKKKKLRGKRETSSQKLGRHALHRVRSI